MGKKKPFVDKKKSSTYHLMHRSQRDIAEELVEGDVNKAGMILWPTKEQNLSTTNTAVMINKDSSNNNVMNEWRNKLEQVGLLDNVDHEKYLKPITGEGTFLDAKTGKAVHLQQQQQQSIAEDALIEVKYDSIPLTTQCMDDDIAAALFNDDDIEYNFEELDDDFVLQAAAEPEQHEENNSNFDFDQHIRQLMEKAKLERSTIETNNIKTHNLQEQDVEFFSNMKPLHEEDDEFDEPVNVVSSKLSPEEEKALCDKFIATLAEYDDDDDSDDEGNYEYDQDYGNEQDQEDDNDNINNNEAVAVAPVYELDDPIIDAALDDFLQEKQDDIYINGTNTEEKKKKTGGTGFSVLVGTKMIPEKELKEENIQQLSNNIEPIDKILQTAKETLAQPKQQPPPEEIFIDGKSYFSERTRNPWDCESIISTYSNLDNNPVTIDSTNKRRRRRKQKNNKNNNKTTIPEEEEDNEPIQHIKLSTKTGLPIIVDNNDRNINGNALNDDHDDDNNNDTYISVNKGIARNKNETIEEKKSRKLLIKREREISRIQKKMMKQVYENEYNKHTNIPTHHDDIAGKTVFRFS